MIIVRLSGGLGNQMFEYAAGRALAKRHDVPLLLDTAYLLDRTPRPAKDAFTFRDYDLDIFMIKAGIASRADVPFFCRMHLGGRLGLALDALLRRLGISSVQEKGFSFDPHFFDIESNAYLVGHWQSPKYFESIAEDIRREFTLVGSLSESAAVLKNEIAACRSLCVHVRRGDFVANAFNTALESEYYDTAVSLVVAARPVDAIYVFSDDIGWCREHLRFSQKTVFIGDEYSEKKFGEKLELMRACTYFVIPNSTYAWWAAWLAADPEKIVVAPKQWLGDPSIDTGDLIPKEWIRI